MRAVNTGVSTICIIKCTPLTYSKKDESQEKPFSASCRSLQIGDGHGGDDGRWRLTKTGRCLRLTLVSPHFSSRFVARVRRGPRRQGARRFERGDVLVQHVEHSNQAQRSMHGPLRGRSRRVMSYAG